MVKISSWGRLSQEEHEVRYLRDNIHDSFSISNKKYLAVGMHRSYGDQCLSPQGILLNATKMDRFIRFDPINGIVNCEAGILLKDIHKVTLSQGWILAVSPGTELITLGGAIANDVHGKNHCAAGSFGHHVIGLSLLRSNGEIIRCSADKNADWFSATVGGMGLSGIILSAEIQLQPVKSQWLDTETLAFDSIQNYFQLENQSEADWYYRVAWIDCVKPGGRGLFMRANHSNQSLPLLARKTSNIGFTPPISLINKWNLKIINEIYFQKGKNKKNGELQDYKNFFYPLDSIHGWNRLYGPKGFYQYQCVIPEALASDAISEILKAISAAGEGSLLGVLKRFGSKESLGMLSFPLPGYTFALDFPNRHDKTEKLFQRLDAITLEAKGRIYLAKDARMPRDIFKRTYSVYEKFLDYRDTAISSSMSRRLMGF